MVGGGVGELPQSSLAPKNELLLPLAQLLCWSQQTDMHMDTGQMDARTPNNSLELCKEEEASLIPSSVLSIICTCNGERGARGTRALPGAMPYTGESPMHVVPTAGACSASHQTRCLCSSTASCWDRDSSSDGSKHRIPSTSHILKTRQSSAFWARRAAASSITARWFIF